MYLNYLPSTTTMTLCCFHTAAKCIGQFMQVMCGNTSIHSLVFFFFHITAIIIVHDSQWCLSYQLQPSSCPSWLYGTTFCLSDFSLILSSQASPMMTHSFWCTDHLWFPCPFPTASHITIRPYTYLSTHSFLVHECSSRTALSLLACCAPCPPSSLMLRGCLLI